MKHFVVHDAAGRILRRGHCNDIDFALQALGGETVIESEAQDFARQYVSADVVITRPLLTTVATWNKTVFSANGTDQATLGSGLPNPTTISITPPAGKGIPAIADQIVTAGSFAFTTTVMGDYIVIAKAFPYQDYTVTIKAREAAAIASSSAAGVLTTAIRLPGAINGSATIAGELTSAISLAGAVASGSAAAGVLTTAIQLSGALNAQAQIAGALTTAIPLAASVSASSTAAGELTTSIRLAGALSAASTMTGTLT
jgi:hypothetical protein